jgi:phospholipid/cholesterol/gamma-HCH transport system substrate-binding protein
MNLLGTPEFKVGVLVVIVAGLIGLMSVRVSQGPGVLAGQKDVYFTVDNAGGLVKNSAVKMAGIKVGVIDEIELVDGRARIRLVLNSDTPVTTSSQVELRSDGILGDKHVEIVPGDPLDPPLKANSEITTNPDQAGLNDLIKQVSEIATSIKELSDNLNNATKGAGDPSTPVGRIVLNIEKVSQDLADMTDINKQKVNSILSRVESLTRNLDDYINEDSLARVDNAIRNIEEVTEKINNGEGTVGRLINDEETVERINTAVEGINEFVGGANKLQTSVDFHSEYLAGVNRSKSYLGVIVQPGLDRYYDIQLVDDPRGVVETTTTESNLDPTEEKTVTYQNEVKFTILFAKNFYDFTLSGGLIESSGGFAVDYHMLDRRLTLSAEFFEFNDLYIRAFGRYNFFKGLYFLAGADNVLSADDTDASIFVGGGIFITNDDLKNLISRVSLN